MNRIWEADYRHDRRAHRHRCFACNRIVTEGERVIMARVGNRTTRALHIGCADKIAINNVTHRELLTMQAGECAA